MERMQAEANQVQAAGIVSTRLVEKSHGWGSHVIEFLAMGTAIAPTGGGTQAAPQMVLSLND